MVTMEQFAQGMTARQYVDQMSMNKERMLSTLDSTVISAADTRILERYAGTRKTSSRSATSSHSRT